MYYQPTFFIIVCLLNIKVLAQEKEFYSEQEIKDIYSLFHLEDMDSGGKQQILNNLIYTLELDKNSDMPVDILDANSGIISSMHPVHFSFKRYYLKNCDLESLLIEFNLELRALSKALKIKRIDGNTYLPLAAIIITLAWDPLLHYFLQEKFRDLEKDQLELVGGPHGECAYCLSTLFGASIYVLKYVNAFTYTHEDLQETIEPKESYLRTLINRCLNRETCDAEDPLLGNS